MTFSCAPADVLANGLNDLDPSPFLNAQLPKSRHAGVFGDEITAADVRSGSDLGNAGPLLRWFETRLCRAPHHEGQFSHRRGGAKRRLEE
jgi:hypothetical protein